MSALKPGIQIRRRTTTQQLDGAQLTAKEKMPTGSERTEDWLRCIKDFGLYLDEVNKKIFTINLRMAKVVKVALLDIGVDLLAASIRGRSQSGTNYFEGDTRHGTHMAASILSICPQIELHFFKVDPSRGPEGEPVVSHGSIAQVSPTFLPYCLTPVSQGRLA
jgi:hypothetical protein